jgi:hypothetical protein
MPIRSEGGLCGPEGALFESRSLPASVLVYLACSSPGRWIVGFALFLLIVGLLGY